MTTSLSRIRPFAPGAPGYVDDGASLWPKFDPAKAKAAAAQYQTETGKKLTFTLNHTADPDTTADAKLVKQMLHDNVGIKGECRDSTFDDAAHPQGQLGSAYPTDIAWEHRSSRAARSSRSTSSISIQRRLPRISSRCGKAEASRSGTR